MEKSKDHSTAVKAIYIPTNPEKVRNDHCKLENRGKEPRKLWMEPSSSFPQKDNQDDSDRSGDKHLADSGGTAPTDVSWSRLSLPYTMYHQ